MKLSAIWGNSVKGKQKQKEDKEGGGERQSFHSYDAIKRAEEKMTEDELNAKQV